MNDNETRMTSARFAALLEAYGAELSHWPVAERLSAHAYAQTAPEAGAQLAEARALDALLAGPPAPRASAALEASILAAAQRLGPMAQGKARTGGLVQRALEALWPRAASWKPASLFASAVVLGALLGVNLWGNLTVPAGASANEDVLAYAMPSLEQDLN